MSRTSRVVRLILLVSCAHALVHLLEQSVASVELVISDEFHLTKQQSGAMGFWLRLPFGIGAFFAGLLADRFGEKRILILYLFGAALTCVSFLKSDSAELITGQMFILGAFASMYHPAGLALLANETLPTERARALGTHGVLGSLGIASAPFIAALMLSMRPGDWRGYYLLLGLISGALAVLFCLYLRTTRESPPEFISSAPRDEPVVEPRPGIVFQWWPYALLVLGTAFSGTIYGGVLHFLPRYLKESGAMDSLESASGYEISDAALGNYAAALALICGAFGQWAAGRMAKPSGLPVLLAGIYASNIPFLIWMTFAVGMDRLIAACLWAFFHFMNQPVYNSLLAEFMPRHRRSVGYGFSNLMGFGVGAVGPPLVAQFDARFADYTMSYSALSVLALIAALLPLPLLSAKRVTRNWHGS